MASEKLDINLTTKVSAKKSERIALGSIPVPYIGYKNAGVNVQVFLVVSAEGNVKLEYGFEQTFDLKVGIMNNESKGELVPIDEVHFDAGMKMLTLQGEAKVATGLETGIYLLIGDISLADLTISINANNGIKGKMVDLSKDNHFNPSVCYRIEPKVIASGKFSLGEKVDTEWFGEIGVEITQELFSKNLYSTEIRKLYNATNPNPSLYHRSKTR